MPLFFWPALAIVTQIAFRCHLIVVPLTIVVQVTFLSRMLTYAGRNSEVKIKLQSRKAIPLPWFRFCIDCIAAFSHNSKTHCRASQAIGEQALDQHHFALQLLDMRTLRS